VYKNKLVLGFVQDRMQTMKNKVDSMQSFEQILVEQLGYNAGKRPAVNNVGRKFIAFASFKLTHLSLATNFLRDVRKMACSNEP